MKDTEIMKALNLAIDLKGFSVGDQKLARHTAALLLPVIKRIVAEAVKAKGKP